MNSEVKRLLRRFVPQSLRPTTTFESWADEVTEGGSRVSFAPFRGVSLGHTSYHSSIYNKLLGIYENELHGVIERVLQMSPSLVVDIGAAEGYFACGFAARCSLATRHVAYEGDFRFRHALRGNLERNGFADRVKVRGFCETESLEQLLSGEKGLPFVLCDVEGLEIELLDPSLVPSRSADRSSSPKCMK